VTLGNCSLFAFLAALGVVAAAPKAAANPSVADSTRPDLTLIVWDTSKSITYFRDLDTTWSTASVGTDLAPGLSFLADTNWSKFLQALGGGLTPTTFYDVVSGTLTGTGALVTTGGTAADGSANTTLTPVTGNQLKAAISNWSVFAVSNASTGADAPHFNTGSPPQVVPNVHGSNISVTGDDGEAATADWQNGFGQQSFSTFATVGTAMNFFEMAGGNAIVKAKVTPLPGQWLLKANGDLTLSLAAVPEPRTLPLLLSGLAAMGLLVRRRRRSL
jgi:hypothetical protein